MYGLLHTGRLEKMSLLKGAFEHQLAALKADLQDFDDDFPLGCRLY